MKKLLLAALTVALSSAMATNGFARVTHRSPHHRPHQRRALVRRTRVLSPPVMYLSGRVVAPGGGSAANAVIYVSWTDQAGALRFTSVRSDREGRFKFASSSDRLNRAGTIGVSAVMDGKVSNWVGCSLGTRALANIRLSVAPTVDVSGHLMTTDGAPVANAEIHAEAVFPHADPGTPAGSQQMALFSGNFFGSASRLAPYDYLARIVPDHVSPVLFHARTDASGQFTVRGLPRGTTLLLRPAAGTILTPNSMAPLALDSRAQQSAGVLVATQPGALNIRVMDSKSRAPAPPSYAGITPLNAAPSGPIFFHGQPPYNMDPSTNIEPRGTEIKNILPGVYSVSVAGRTRIVQVMPGKTARVEFALRQGPLIGRLLDAAGRPVANVGIMLKTEITQSGIARQSFERISERSFDSNGFDNQNAGGWERQPVVSTSADGTFTIPNFPWGCLRVLIRATKGNDRAEFSDLVAAIRSRVEMRMHRGALVSVTGRMIDPKRRPVVNVACQALHWQPTPRTAWFASAHEVRVNSRGRFRVDGLERGESFSIITGPQQVQMKVQTQQAVTRTPGVHTVSLASSSSVRDFKSPRFAVSREAAVQDLGDVMVHPSTAPEEVMQSYGAAPREVASAGVVEAPARGAVQQAKLAAKQYDMALRSGDVRTLHALTSHLSAAYAPRLQEFLARADIGGAAARSECGAESLTALRFAPRQLLKNLVRGGNDLSSSVMTANILQNGDFVRSDPPIAGPAPVSRALDFSRQASTGEQDIQRSWVVLTAKTNNALTVAAVLHFEEGAWRVASLGTPHVPVEQLGGMFGGAFAKPTETTKTSPKLPMDRFIQARETGLRFLRDWAANRPESMRKATSRMSFGYADNITQYKKQQEHRVDQGNCPLNPDNRFALEPVADTTVWDSKWLWGLAAMHGLTQDGFSRFNTVAAATGKGLAFETSLKRGDVALLRYSAPNGRFLMTLARQHGMWKVIEPALPL